MSISNILVNWYESSKRDLPWRRTSDPYCIWISEVILQQTRVNQGMDYYYRFLERFPDVFSLAEASEEEVLKLWQGLGYYSRARNLHFAARMVVDKFNGVFPGSFEGLKQLKGVGEYTAAAIASISFGESVPVIDGNVARVLSRLYAIEEAVNSSSGMKMLRSTAAELIKGMYPAQFNQAIMEFGALQCKPVNPDCSVCPLQSECLAFKKKMVGVLPFKEKKTKIRDLYIYYFVLISGSGKQGSIVLNKRTAEGIWKNLYDFPSMESEKELELHDLLKSPIAISLFGDSEPEIISISGEYSHQLSHKSIKARFIKLRNSEVSDVPTSFYKTDFIHLQQYPLPRLISRFLEAESLY
ncbi:MAG: A/G-specific adenine glycosylase [Bacteroidales bacterium]|nr:A/G-specific adenine glycosylase [Bacteroidales bacterium]